jgi:hypothetical protein
LDMEEKETDGWQGEEIEMDEASPQPKGFYLCQIK